MSSDIASRLGERHRVAIGQIRAIVRQCGVEQTMRWLDAAIAIEAGDGMRTADGQRRRTLGGVFFAHVVQELRAAGRTDDVAIIRPREHRSSVASPRVGQQHPHADTPSTTYAEPPITWDTRSAAWDAVPSAGVASGVKFRVVVALQQEIVTPPQTLLPVVHRSALPAAIRGAPLPPAPLATSYLVAIGGKPWRKLGARTPGATLQLRGFAFDDAALQTMRLVAVDPPMELAANPEKPVKPGETRTPGFTVITTIGTPLVRPDIVLVRAAWRSPFPSAPGGIALPQTAPVLHIGVVVRTKLWNKQLAEVLADQPDTKVVFEGAGLMDRELGLLTVYATTVTVPGRKPADAVGS